MFKRYTFNTYDASRSCRAYLGIDHTTGGNSHNMSVTVCFHRIKKNEPTSMNYLGGVVIKKGMPHWGEFKIMLSEAIARSESEMKLDDDCSLMIGSMRTFA